MSEERITEVLNRLDQVRDEVHEVRRILVGSGAAPQEGVVVRLHLLEREGLPERVEELERWVSGMKAKLAVVAALAGAGAGTAAAAIRALLT